MSHYTNSTDVSIGEIARLMFYDMVSDQAERKLVADICMHIGHMKNLRDIISKTLDDHEKATSEAVKGMN